MTRWVETFQRSMIIAKCIPVFSTVFSSSVHTNLPNTFNLIGFPISWYWTYLMKVILNVPDEDYSWTYLMKVIMNVPDEGYYECTWWRLLWTYLMKVIMNVPDEGYSWTYLMKVIPERTRWRLFLNVPDEGYSWTYLMKVIPERTWWRLLQKSFVQTNFDIYFFISAILCYM